MITDEVWDSLLNLNAHLRDQRDIEGVILMTNLFRAMADAIKARGEHK